MPQLLTAQTEDGSSSTSAWSGGNGTFFVEGVFDGATVTLEWKKYGSEWNGLDYRTTVSSSANIAFFSGACDLRVTLNAAGSSTNINAGIESV